MKYSILLSIKESYLFSRNLFGLWQHPFKTLRAIFREEDISQFLIIFGLPLLLVTFGLFFIFVTRFVIGAPQGWGLLAKALFFLIFIVAFLLFFYLSFWFYKVFKSKR